MEFHYVAHTVEGDVERNLNHVDEIVSRLLSERVAAYAPYRDWLRKRNLSVPEDCKIICSSLTEFFHRVRIDRVLLYGNEIDFLTGFALRVAHYKDIKVLPRTRSSRKAYVAFEPSFLPDESPGERAIFEKNFGCPPMRPKKRDK